MNMKYLLACGLLACGFLVVGCSDDKKESSTKKVSKPKESVKKVKKTVVKKKKEPKYTVAKGWSIAKVKLSHGGYHIYEVMTKPVTQNDFKKNNNSASMTNVNTATADRFCVKFANASLAKEFVFSSALRSLKKPSSNIHREILLPYDEEDDDIYFQKGKTRETSDTKIFLYDWGKRTYKSTSKLFKSKTTTFRCMRRYTK